MNKTQDFISALHGKPNLYGPFWVAVTLCFSTTICGSLANFLQNQGNPKYQYTPEFERVTSAASAIFGYAFIFPFLISVKGFFGEIKMEELPKHFEFIILGTGLPCSILWG